VRTATALSPNDASVSVKKPSACEASLQIGTQRITALSKLRQKRSESKPQLVRIAHREIEILGLGQGFWGDLHHRSMSVHWPVFFGSAAAMFVVLNAIFGFLYSLGQEPIANAPENGPLAYFYFSIETLATVGYGDMHPKSNYGHLIATIEIFTGMSFLAVMTGLIFARFSRPRARFFFANNPVITRHEGRQTLMIRVAKASNCDAFTSSSSIAASIQCSY
jgi:Ion channel